MPNTTEQLQETKAYKIAYEITWNVIDVLVHWLPAHLTLVVTETFSAWRCPSYWPWIIIVTLLLKGLTIVGGEAIRAAKR
jgi:hypothetical protein